MRGGEMSEFREETENKYGWHKGTDVTAPMHQQVRESFKVIHETLEDLLPPGRARSLALTELENAAMWANKSVAELAPVVTE
jgi:hypothetical protein